MVAFFHQKPAYGRVAAVCALSLTLAACGAAQGSSPSPSVSVVRQETQPADPATSTASAAAPSEMPDFVGKPFEEAHSTLALYNVSITQVPKVSEQPVGTVIAQDPVGGASFSQQVTLTVSTAPATVPELVGMTFGDVQVKLQELGLQLTEVPDFDDPRADGLVIAQDPPTGTANAGEVKVTVVRRPVENYLSDVQSVTQYEINGPNVGPAKANGISYSHAVTLGPGQQSTGYVEYDLSREYRRLVGALAFADDSASNAQYKVEIYGDGRQLYASTIKFGETDKLKVDVTKVLRLRLSLTDTSGDTNGQESKLVLGDVRSQGLPSEVSTPSPSPSPS